MIKLYANENFPFPVVEKLRELGYDVLTIQETGKAGQALPDEEVLKFASDNGRAVITLNRKHFIKLHQVSSDHAGIIACTLDLEFVDQAQRIHNAIESHDTLSGQLLRVNRPS